MASGLDIECLLSYVIEAIDRGEPVPAPVRKAIIQSLKGDTTLEQALLVNYYRALGHSLSTNDASLGSAFNMAAIVMCKSPKTIESNHRKFQDTLEAASESDEFQIADVSPRE